MVHSVPGFCPAIADFALGNDALLVTLAIRVADPVFPILGDTADIAIWVLVDVGIFGAGALLSDDEVGTSRLTRPLLDIARPEQFPVPVDCVYLKRPKIKTAIMRMVKLLSEASPIL